MPDEVRSACVMRDGSPIPVGGPGAGVFDTGAPTGLFERILRLRPFSGIQFVDFSIPTSALSITLYHFLEESLAGSGTAETVLVPLEREHAGDGPIWHPVTRQPLDPDRAFRVTGQTAIAPFLGNWIPLPYLRFLGRDDAGKPRLDSGPTNWVRAFLVPPRGGLDRAEEIKVVLAFDTRLATESRISTPRYCAPNVDDARFSSTFVFASGPEDTATFVSEPWLERWLAESRPEGPERRAPAGSGTFRHARIACYLGVLNLIQTHCKPPQVRFSDTLSRETVYKRVGVDLWIDVGAAHTTAALVEPSSIEPLHDTSASRLVELRDLSRPDLRYERPVPTDVEFDRAPFGNPAVSRLSGRKDAFVWPSLVRIGNEAGRLGLRPSAADGVTGLRGVRKYLKDNAALAGVWRQSIDGEAGQPGPMVAGPLLALLTEEGRVPEPTEADRAPAVRARFSRSSLMAMFISELLLHSMGQLNPPRLGEDNRSEIEIRVLRRIVVAIDAGTPEDEAQVLLERVKQGVALIWQALGWDNESGTGSRPRPEVVRGLGGNLGRPVGFVFDSVCRGFGGNIREFLAVTNGMDRSRGVPQQLRIAALDLAPDSTGLVMLEFKSEGRGDVLPRLLTIDRNLRGRDQVVSAIVWSHLLPAIECRLEACGLKGSKRFIAELFEGAATSALEEESFFVRRLSRRVLLPAARALLDLLEERGADIASGRHDILLARLVELGQGRMSPIDGVFDGAAERAGAERFALRNVPVSLARSQLSAIIVEEYGPLLSRLGALIRAQDCDLLLVGGAASRLPDVVELVYSLLPVPANRVLLSGSTASLSDAASPRQDRGGRLVLSSAASTYLAGNDLLRTPVFSIPMGQLVRESAALPEVRSEVPSTLAATRSRRQAEARLATTGPDRDWLP